MTRAPTAFRHRRVIAALAIGGAVFLIGWAAALRVLPEWRASRLPARAEIVARFSEILRASGAVPLAGSPRASLSDDPRLLEAAYANLGADAADWLAGRGCAPSIAVLERVTPTPDSGPGAMSLFLCADRVPWHAQSMADDWFQSASRPYAESPVRALVGRLVASGGTGVERELGEPQTLRVANSDAHLYTLPTPAGSVPEYLQVMAFPGPGAVAFRLPGTVADAIRNSRPLSWGLLLRAAPGLVLVLGVCVLFVVLLIRRHVDFANAAWIAGLALLGTVGTLGEAMAMGSTLSSFALGAAWFGSGLALFVFWSAAESWLRATLPGFSTSLDAVRAGRLGPRAGTAILAGWGLGSGLAGMQLLFFSLAALSGSVHPKQWSVATEAFGGASAFARAPLQAGLVVLAIAAARRLSSARFAPALAVALVTLLHGAPSFEPWAAGLVASMVLAAVLVFAHQAFGLTAVLVAAFNSLCLPVAVFASRHPDWMTAALVTYGLASLSLLVIGAVAISRREEPASERAGVPRFVRRLEEERRLRYEMDLLARMQLGLLPSRLPEVSGWTIAARSLLANEVGGDLYDFIHDERGRLWIAAGDVAGHGFSCAITQAMTKAALVSLVYSGTTPSEVLLEIDRVLRTGGSERSFVSLLLVRFDPASGEALVANAGHPYPLLCGRAGVRELTLPGLPLGRGPARSYHDVALHIEPGEALVIASDGLFEALDEHDENYGFDRAAALLAGENGASSQELLERVVADWSRFRGARPAADDTTLVVLRRGGPGEG